MSDVKQFSQLANDFAQATGDLVELYADRHPPRPLQEAFMGRLSSGSKHVMRDSDSSLFPEEGLFDINGNGLLHYAVEGGNGPLTKRLVTEKPELITQTNSTGRFPLHAAIWAEHIEPVKILLKNNADINCVDMEGNTPLMLAVALENVELIKVLLKNKANVGMIDKDGMAAMHFAAALGNPEVVQILFDAGADPNQKDLRERTPLHYASLSEDNQALDLLISLGGNESERDATGNTPEKYRGMAIEGDKRASALATNAKEKAIRKIQL